MIPKIGVIGGSGVYQMDGIENPQWVTIQTPWGAPSDDILTGTLNGNQMAFLPRHGRGHFHSPTSVPYRANIDALKRLGCTDIIAVSAVGSLRADYKPGDFVLVDQYIDRTFAREKSFFGPGCVAHVSVAHPTCARLGEAITRAAAGLAGADATGQATLSGHVNAAASLTGTPHAMQTTADATSQAGRNIATGPTGQTAATATTGHATAKHATAGHATVATATARHATASGEGKVATGLTGSSSNAATQVAITLYQGATYLVMEGPQFSTLAESRLYRQWGADVIGMTGMPEAKLAREAEMCYASVAMVTAYDCWHEGHGAVDVAQVIATLTANATQAATLITNLRLTRPDACPCGCDRALTYALMTAPAKRDPDLMARLDAVAGRML